MDLNEIEKQVTTWHREIFPNATQQAIINKFQEETNEFKKEYLWNKEGLFSINSAREFVDMVIVYMSGLDRLGMPTLTELIAEKLEINKARKWGKEEPDGNRLRDK